MLRVWMAGLLTAGLCLAGAASAAPKEEGKATTCTKGQGTAVCCKTYVKDHCSHYTSCCEHGNAGFFSKKHCSSCEKQADERAKVAKSNCSGSACTGHSSEGSAYTKCCDIGNRGFFSSAGCGNCSKHAKAAKAETAACCAGEKKAK
jgi:hypothetical protein